MIPRAAFLPAQMRGAAALDAPLPIGAGQTTSQPSLVRHMVAALALSPEDRALEVGTGTGYAAAMIAQTAREVYAVERIPELAQRARATLKRLGLDNAHVVQGDGAHGLAAHAPYDAILVSAAASDVPRALLAQLAIGGRLVIPVGNGATQRLMRIVRVRAQEFRAQDLGAVQFVPLVRPVMGAIAAQDEYGTRP
jgi:protein-L-isoaspartate(D-aspartate) O-methyltransferase